MQILATGTVLAETENPLVPASYDLLWSAVIFVVVLVFFWKLILPRVQKMLDARSAAIEGQIEAADQANKEAEEARQKYVMQLAAARDEAAGIRESAQSDAKSIVAEARDRATQEAARVTANAQTQIEAERQMAMISLRSEVGTMAVNLASGVVGESLSDDAKAKRAVDRFVAELEASHRAQNDRVTRG